METPNLPLFLRERYSLSGIRLFGRTCVLALEGNDWDAGSPSEYETQSRALANKLGQNVILVLRVISPYTRSRLIRLGVPFIVPGSQMFIPYVMLDLRERFASAINPSRKRLSPTAQLVLLSYLLKTLEGEVPLQEIAHRLHCSAMMITKAKDELEAADLCETRRTGRAVFLKFLMEGHDLWQKALPVLASPMHKAHWIRWEQPGYPAIPAGITALSQKTMLADDPLPTFALDARSFRSNLETGLYRLCRGAEEANIRMEAWRYNPLLLAGKGAYLKPSAVLESVAIPVPPSSVDPLSLYLSLRDEPDERVQQQLEVLIQNIFPD
jgi:DNA-binding MarR family transcriptional regulator